MKIIKDTLDFTISGMSAVTLGKFDGILICTDLDGTLLKNDKTISRENLDAIEYFKKEGGYFTFITGRMPYFAREIYNRVSPNAPIGCINGGGQPYVRECFLPNEDLDIMDTYKEKRAAALYSEDERQVLRQSHKNPQVQKLYEDYLGKPNSHKAHELLHTHYTDRSAK